jgi:hypothetical protein
MVNPGGMALVVVWPLVSSAATVPFVVIVQKAPPPPEVLTVRRQLLVNGELAVKVKFVGAAKKFVAAERASYAPATAAVPTPQRKMKAKLERAAGFAKKFRTSGSTCSKAASRMA